MKLKFSVVFLVSLLTFPVFLDYSHITVQAEHKAPDLFLGVDVAYADLGEIKALVDEVSSYTNLFVIGCTGITYNYTSLNETCQYVYDRGMHFIVYRDYSPRQGWLEYAKKTWDSYFLGLYVFDEVGGRQLDQLEDWVTVLNAASYTDAESQFVDSMNMALNWVTRRYSNSTDTRIFTSDYALYWFDYKAGYDVLLTQFVWNYSRQLNVALCRGAANVQNKDWGVMITWKYAGPPYIESGADLYRDMVLAYDNGAKYIVVFDSNKNYTHGILRQEHLDALKQFWQYAHDNPGNDRPAGDRVAYVLPRGYAYGFRGPEDKIWGLWPADALSTRLCNELSGSLNSY